MPGFLSQNERGLLLVLLNKCIQESRNSRLISLAIDLRNEVKRMK